MRRAIGVPAAGAADDRDPPAAQLALPTDRAGEVTGIGAHDAHRQAVERLAEASVYGFPHHVVARVAEDVIVVEDPHGAVASVEAEHDEDEPIAAAVLRTVASFDRSAHSARYDAILAARFRAIRASDGRSPSRG